MKSSLHCEFDIIVLISDGFQKELNWSISLFISAFLSFDNIDIIFC